MEMMNRTALVVTPKRRALQWVNALPDTPEPMRDSELPSMRTVYLIATGDHEPDLADLIDTYCEEIFEEFLNDWYRDESLWPPNRTQHTFRDWFAVDWIDGVVDADPAEPLTIHELARTRCAVCEAPLAETQVLVATDGDRVFRLTGEDLVEWQRAIDAGEEPPARATTAFRCCGSDCAQQAEDAFRKNGPTSKVGPYN